MVCVGYMRNNRKKNVNIDCEKVEFESERNDLLLEKSLMMTSIYPVTSSHQAISAWKLEDDTDSVL